MKKVLLEQAAFVMCNLGVHHLEVDVEGGHLHEMKRDC